MRFLALLTLVPMSAFAVDFADISALQACHCWDGSPCICGEGCRCVNCPFHNKAFADARRALVFTASWCGPCKTAKAEREKLRLKVGIDYELVDIDKQPDTAKKYGVREIPYLILLEGQEVKTRFVGATGQAKRIQEWMCSPMKDSRIEKDTRTVSYPRREPVHTHRCNFCGNYWSHENFNFGNPAAHHCPSCGQVTMGNRTEGWIH